jgi:two-component system cell cycle sensor histidine kinase/response regulator CckA
MKMGRNDPAGDDARLRHVAEEAALGQAVQLPESLEALSAEEARRTLHELRVHQIELQMQNEELRATQANLDAERARYLDLYDLAPVGYCTVSERGHILEANLTVAGLLRVNRGSLINQSITKFIFNEDQDTYYLHQKGVLGFGEKGAWVLRMLREDGTVFWARHESSAVRLEGGAPAGRIVISDITEFKQAEIELHEIAQRLKLATDAAQIGVFDHFLAEDKLIWDEHMFRIYGIDEAGFLGCKQAWLRALHPEDAPRVRQEDHDAITGKQPFDTQFRIVWPDGQVRQIEAHAVVQRDLDGIPRRITGVNRDVTERVQMEALLMQAQKMESVGRLAGGVAHDFNNLLTVINGYSRISLRKMSSTDPLRGNLETILKAGEQATGLTRQLLAFSRHQMSEPKLLDLNRVVADLRPMLIGLVPENIDLQFTFGAGIATVYADPHQIEQVVMNLVVNAKDAMPLGGKLVVETAVVERDPQYVQSHPEARPGRYVELTVTDTGTGMNEKTKERVFEPFFTTKDVGKGTGLGLSMVHGIVEQSHGYIAVSSELGHGTVFRIYLPEAQTGAPGSVADAPLGERFAPPVVRGETVLVVEDQAAVRDYVALTLKAYGYRVIAAENGAAAIAIWEKKASTIDLVLTDVVMPGMDGRQLARHLRQVRPGIKVLFMSGYAEDDVGLSELSSEGADIIAKPFGPEQLGTKIREALAT